jgi:hypothetical protein
MENLILRITNSPYGDINKGSVLSQGELDSNFIILKGDSIYTAITNNNVLTLKKYNGGDISITLPTYSGGTIIEGGYWNSGSTGNHSLKTINDTNVDATGDYSIAIGEGAIAEGRASFSSGRDTVASGDFSSAFGSNTVASSYGDRASGRNTIASGGLSNSKGHSTVASGYISSAGGVGVTAYGKLSFVHFSGDTNFIPNDGVYGASGTSSTILGGGKHKIHIGSDNSSILGGNTSVIDASKNSAIIGGIINSVDNSEESGIFIGEGNSISDSNNSVIIGGQGNYLNENTNSAIVGGNNNVFNSSVSRSIILGGSNIFATMDDTAYVANLNINTTPEINNSLTKVLSRESNGSVSEIELSSLNTIYSGTHATLNVLKNEKKLITGNKYILTDYQTKYIVNGSDSSTRQQIHTVIGSASNFTQFNNVPNTIAANGDVVTVVFAPSGSTVTTGQTFTIVNYFNVGYIQFSPLLTGAQNIGVQLRFEKQRYSNIPNNIIINDVNGKPVFKPTGVLNTEVHDGLPYMSMSGIENPAPFIEQISLTAIDSSNFSINAESLTFIGDKLEYDFNDTIINDDNGNFKANRNGFILKRENVYGNISVDKDWRVQRYRRFQMDDFNWNGFLHKKEFSELSGTSGSTIYKILNVNYCTNNNPTISLNHRYIMSEPIINNFYTDFAKSVSNPFISGTTSAPTVTVGNRLPLIDHISNFSVNVSLPLSGLTGTTLAKDFHIIPIISGEPKELVSTFKVNNLNNSVFLDYSQRYGVAGVIFIDSNDGYIYNTSVMSSANIINKGSMNNFISIDNISLINNGKIFNSNNLGYTDIANYGVIINSSFGQGFISGTNEFLQLNIDSNSSLLDTIVGGLRNDGINLTNFMSSQNILINKIAGSSVIGGNTFLTLFKNANTMYGSEINLKTFVNQIPNKGFWGYIYDFDVAISDTYVNNFNQRKHLIYQNIDVNNITSVTTITTVT